MKNLFALLLLGATLFVGCSDDEDSSLVIDGTNLVGTWAITEDHYTQYYGKSDKIEQIVVIKGESIHWYEPKDSWYDRWHENNMEDGFKYANGILYGCSMSDFIETGEAKCNVSDGRLYVATIYQPVTGMANDKFSVWEKDNEMYGIYERVKAFQ